MSTNSPEPKQSQISAEKRDNSNSSNEELIQTEILGEGHIHLVTVEGKSFLSVGNIKVSDEYETREEAIAEYNKDEWGLRIRVMFAVIHLTKRFEELGI